MAGDREGPRSLEERIAGLEATVIELRQELDEIRRHAGMAPAPEARKSGSATPYLLWNMDEFEGLLDEALRTHDTRPLRDYVETHKSQAEIDRLNAPRPKLRPFNEVEFRLVLEEVTQTGWSREGKKALNDYMETHEAPPVSPQTLTETRRRKRPPFDWTRFEKWVKKGKEKKRKDFWDAAAYIRDHEPPEEHA